MTQYINETTLAERLCISASTLRKWRWEGKGPKFIKVGHRVLYREEDINSYIEAQVRKSTSDTGVFA